LQLSPIDIMPVVQEAMRELAVQADGRAVRLSLQAGTEPGLRVNADATRVKQVLLNLLSNAIKYNQPGGAVVVRSVIQDGWFELRVEDTGVGMSPDQLAGLFQPFNRLGREDSAVEGSGIGLVITRSLVTIMGGRLLVTSQPGQGSCFAVHLPLVLPGPGADDVRAKGGTTSIQAGHAGVMEVLYVDDDAVNRLLMEAFLALRPGFNLRMAENGQEGLAAARSRPPDLMLIDMMMPGLSGLQVLAALRSDARLAATRCIAVSANAMPEEINIALAAGFDGYLTKPLASAQLFLELERVLALERAVQS